ncbi:MULTISPECIES: histidine kinase [unclassified Rhizobacter]|uniref:sensor histidine kinase n=1 Tax=unclassified Rhizobacter TaxID=2640088 RepID=UPI0006F5A800|nr:MULTISPECIES: histidine kinase [unclassified Rhizobacter]KQU67900.1 hypothetical protein ASC88_08035 [Rhizobacter sp. Root29]KQW15213.1 hypothetical protein ASC98_13880 [Rhizobacter sp. Root1238]KRB24377.1 hypothetical protein ASE08_17865 [Rhizobacter sp. Root16D2]
MRCDTAWWIERGKAALAALLLVGVAAAAHAQHAVFEGYQQSAGLTNMAVGCLTQATDGTLWICTENGLFRFDGFRIRREALPPGAERAVLLTARADGGGRLWIATDLGLFLRRETDGRPAWTAVTQPGGALIGVEGGQRIDVDERGIVYAIDRSSRVWAIDATAPAGQAPAVQRVKLPAFPAPPGAVDADSGALRAGRGALWFGCGLGLCEWRDGTLRTWGEAEGLPARMWGNLVLGRDGSVWARSSDRLAQLRPAQHRFIAVEAPAAQRLPATSALAEDPAGRIVVATDAGVARWDGQRWQSWTSKEGLPETLVRSLLFDAEGALWLGSSGRGLHHWVGYGQADHWTPAQGLPAPAAFSFARDGRGHLWAGTAQGIARLDEAGERLQPLASSRPKGAANNIAVAADGALWWVEAGRVLRLRTGAAGADTMFNDPSLVMALQGTDGAIYLTGRHGVDRIVATPSGVRRQPVADGLPEREWVGGVVVAGTGPTAVEWFVGERRIFRAIDNAWVPMRDEHGQVIETDGHASVAGASAFWVVDSHSLALYTLEGGANVRLVRRFDLALFGDPAVYFLRGAPDGRLWFGTDHGAFIQDGGHWSHIDRTNGLLWDDIDDGAVLLEADGTAWIGTSAGITRLRPAQAKEAPAALRADTLRFGAKTASPASLPQIAWDDRHLQLTLATPSIARGRTLRVEYRLDDDATWRAIEGNVVTIESPEAGSHLLEVRAGARVPIAEAGPPLRIAFAIEPPWWRSAPAKLAAAAALALLWWLSNLVANRRQRRDRERLERAVAERTAELETSRQALRRLGEHNTHALEDERRRIARELHDEMGQQLAALRMEASVLRARARGERPPAQEHFQLLLDRIDHLAGGVRALVKQLRPPALDGGLAAALEWLAAEFTHATGAPCRLQLDAAADGLAPDAATQLFRLAQESLTNVRRHAQASEVSVSLQRDAQAWVLTITDDGAGFDPARERSGHGLLGMEERARLLGGSFELDSRPGAGTTVRVRFEEAARNTTA